MRNIVTAQENFLTCLMRVLILSNTEKKIPRYIHRKEVCQDRRAWGSLCYHSDSTTWVTLRERDSKQQIRVHVDEVVHVVREVISGVHTWADVLLNHPPI